MATQIDLGAVVPIGKGDWNPSTTYERANIVRHNSVAWICKVATSLGVEPTEDSSDWYLLVKDTSSVTSINGMRGDVTIDSVLENPSIDDNSLKIASTAWTNTKISQAAGLPLGHIYLWPFSTPPDGSIQLNGGTYSRELYSDLWNLIQTKGWYKPEAEWQSIASANGGYCPWYSDGDGSTTFRVPKFAPYQKLTLASNDAGKYYDAGLPNIEGAVGGVFVYGEGGTGAFLDSVKENPVAFTDNGLMRYQWRTLNFKASNSNVIYGNSDTIQPESHDWIVCVVAFGTATNVGSVDVVNVMSAVNQVQSEINQVQSEIKVILPVGSIIASAMNVTPDGYLICNGAAISRTTYAALFAAIGKIYGEGDGLTTFNLPDLTNRFIQGSSTVGVYKSSGLPNIEGTIVIDLPGGMPPFENSGHGALFNNYSAKSYTSYASSGSITRSRDNILQFNASRSSSIYGNSLIVQPPALTMRYYIKY